MSSRSAQSFKATLSSEDMQRLLAAAKPSQPVVTSARAAVPRPVPAQAPAMMNMTAMMENASGPVQGTCPSCKKQIVTLVAHEYGSGSALTSCFLCCCCGVLGGLIPCC